MKWIGQHIYDLAARFRGDVTIEGDLTVNGTYTQIDTDVTTTEQWLVTNDGTGPAAIINQKGSQDIFDVQDDGTSVFYIEDGGNVGIGTTSPSKKLQVAGDILLSSTTDKIYFNNDSNYHERNSIVTTATNLGLYNNYSSGYITLNTNAGEAARITSAGNVGIGTSSPANKLDVVSTGTYAARFRGPSATYVQSGESTLSGESGFLARNSTGAFYLGVAGGVAYLMGTSGANTMTLGVGGAEKMRLTSGGNVGIGTTSPSVGLQLGNNSSGQTKLAIFNSEGGNENGLTIQSRVNRARIKVADNDTSVYMVAEGSIASFGMADSAAATNISVLSSGNVGIGTTSPGQKLEVNGNAVVSGNMMLGSSASGEYITRTGSPYRLGLFTNSAERISVINGGNVGIGTTSPASKLHVAGTVQVGVDDTGHDVRFYGATSGRYMEWDESENSLDFKDTTFLRFGNGDDFQFSHTGSASNIINYTGDLIVRNGATDKDIVFQCDDGSGGETAYLTLDGSAGYTTVQKQIRFDDSVPAKFGTGNDLHIFHDGTDSLVDNYTGDLYFRQTADDKDIIFQSDDGSGGLETYFFLDGSSGRTVFPDSKYIVFGTDNNLFLTHNGTDSYIQNYTSGHLYIDQQVDDADIVLRSDDGSGGITPYLTLDGSAGYTTVQKQIRFLDSVSAVFGTSGDFTITHDATDSTILNATGDFVLTNQSFSGDLIIENQANDKDIIFKSDDGSGGVTPYLTLDGGEGRLVYSVWSRHIDGARILIGTSGDLALYHDSSNSYIENATGDLIIQNFADDKDIILKSDNGSGGTTAYLTLDGGLGYSRVHKTLRFDDSTLLALGVNNDFIAQHDGTDTSLYNDTGDLYIANRADDKDIIFQSDDGSGGVAIYTMLDGSEGRISTKVNNRFDDGARLELGTSGDLDLYHDGSNSYIDQNGTGNLYIRNTQEDGLIYMQSNYNGSVSSFFYLHGAYSSSNPYTIFPDNSIAAFGNSADLRIYHDGSNSYIKEVGTGTLRLQTNGGGIDLYKDSTEFLARFITDGAAELYYDSVKKLETVTGGVNITGELEADSLDIDGDADISGNITTASWRGDRITTAYQYQRQTFEFKGYATHDGTNYEIANIMTDTNAPFEHDESIGADGTTAIAVSKLIRAAGQLMPYAGTIKKWLGFAAGSGSGTTNIALFRYRPDPSSTSDQSLVLIDDQALTMNGNNGVVQIDQSSFTDPDIAAGDIILTGIKGVSAKTTYFTSTLEIEWD